LISVGINTAPLAAARTGVGRYIAGLLDGVVRLRPPDVTIRPLFGPGPASRFRGLLRLLPGSYALAESARARKLRSERLSVYHETNHAAPRFDGPVVLTVHDLSTVLHAQTQDPRRARHFAQALLRRARDAERVITPTAAVADEVVQHLGVAREKIRFIHHGVDALFAPDPRIEREPFVLFVGADGPRKGLETLRAALPEGVPLIQAGPPRFVPEPELLSLYRRASVLVLPSIYEGFGFPLIEAFACGTPAVASDDPALLEVSGGTALHFPRGDAGALRALLQRVLAERSLRDDLSARGLERVKRFRWDDCAAAHIEVYLEAAQ
jgi:glycosyltransferase involved in cell wall biosynthesis